MVLEQLIPIEQIRARSYTLWNREGRLEGHAEEYWFRAIAELESELEHAWLIALEVEEHVELVMPHPPISEAPHRHEADRIDPDQIYKAA
jgi:hypothetical protein